MKPTKHGIKLYSVCESNTGYCCTYEIYHGRTPGAVGERTYALVFRMLEHADLLDKGYKVFADR